MKVPLATWPSSLHTTLAVALVVPMLHTLPQCPLEHTSRRPILVELPCVSRTAPVSLQNSISEIRKNHETKQLSLIKLFTFFTSYCTCNSMFQCLYIYKPSPAQYSAAISRHSVSLYSLRVQSVRRSSEPVQETLS